MQNRFEKKSRWSIFHKIGFKDFLITSVYNGSDEASEVQKSFLGKEKYLKN